MPALKRYTIKLISKTADFDVTFEGIVSTSAKKAGEQCLRFMANPDSWLVVTPEGTPAPPPLCSKCGGSGSLGPYQDCQYCDGIDRR